jgi:hypothetical protein
MFDSSGRSQSADASQMLHGTDAKIIFVDTTSIIQQYSIRLFNPDSEAIIGASYRGSLPPTCIAVDTMI